MARERLVIKEMGTVMALITMDSEEDIAVVEAGGGVGGAEEGGDKGVTAVLKMKRTLFFLPGMWSFAELIHDEDGIHVDGVRRQMALFSRRNTFNKGVYCMCAWFESCSSPFEI